MLLSLLLACATEPASPPVPPAMPDPAAEQVGQALSQVQAPWVQPGGAGAMAMAAAASPRQQADELFNVAMMAHETGDTATAAIALPQALQAYAAVPDLDDDGHFHVAVLQLALGRPADAMATADRVLSQAPHHLLALGIGGRAAREAGDAAAAERYNQAFRAAWPTESEHFEVYGHHQRLLPKYLAEAGG